MNLHAIWTVLMGTEYLFVSLGVLKAQSTTTIEVNGTSSLPPSRTLSSTQSASSSLPPSQAPSQSVSSSVPPFQWSPQSMSSSQLPSLSSSGSESSSLSPWLSSSVLSSPAPSQSVSSLPLLSPSQSPSPSLSPSQSVSPLLSPLRLPSQSVSSSFSPSLWSSQPIAPSQVSSQSVGPSLSPLLVVLSQSVSPLYEASIHRVSSTSAPQQVSTESVSSQSPLLSSSLPASSSSASQQALSISLSSSKSLLPSSSQSVSSSQPVLSSSAPQAASSKSISSSQSPLPSPTPSHFLLPSLSPSSVLWKSLSKLVSSSAASSQYSSQGHHRKTSPALLHSPSPSPSQPLLLSSLIWPRSWPSLSPSQSPWPSLTPATLLRPRPSPSPAQPISPSSFTASEPVILILVEGDVTIDDTWISDYSDTTSQKYKALKRELTEHLTKVLKKAYEEDFVKVEVSNFRKGSLIFDCRIYFKAKWSSSLDKLKDVIKRGEGGSKRFSQRTTHVNITNVFPSECPTEETIRDSGLARWIVVLIVSGVVIVILVIVVVVLRIQNRGLKRKLYVRAMHMFSDDEKPFVKTIYNPSGSTLEMIQLSSLEKTNTPKTASGRSHGEELKTFSPEPDSSGGFLNENYLDNGEKETEVNDNSPRGSDDGEEKVDHAPDNSFT